MRSQAALPLAQCGSAALSRALVVSLCLRELTSLPTLLESADYREGCFSVRFPFSLGVSTTPRAGRVGGSAAASRAKLPQQMLCRRVECAVVAHQRHAHIGKAENLQHGIMDTMGALKRNEQ